MEPWFVLHLGKGTGRLVENSASVTAFTRLQRYPQNSGDLHLRAQINQA